MADLIYREEAKEIITDWGLRYSIYPSIMDELFEKINKQPPADTERHGHYENNIFCSSCGCSIPTDDNFDFIDKTEVKYCYRCGCKMD